MKKQSDDSNRNQSAKSVNPILVRAASEVAFFIHVIIGCIPDKDSRECLSADWDKMTEVIKVYL